jgi:hypothetical protein
VNLAGICAQLVVLDPFGLRPHGVGHLAQAQPDRDVGAAGRLQELGQDLGAVSRLAEVAHHQLDIQFGALQQQPEGPRVAAPRILQPVFADSGLGVFNAFGHEIAIRIVLADHLHDPYEAVKKLGQAPSRPLIFQGFRRFRSEPVPFFHSSYAFGSGDWHLSDLLVPLYPAEISGRYDLQPVGVEQAVKLEPVGALAKKIDWTKPPVVLWQHVMKAKPDATVHVAAGGHPLIFTRPYGKGQVCFITAAPLGDAPPGETAFWDWHQWPKLMGALIRDLMATEVEKPSSAAKKG